MIKSATQNSAAPATAATHGQIKRNIDTGEIALFLDRTKYITLVPPVESVYQLIGYVQDDWHDMSTQRWEDYTGSVVLSNCTAEEHAAINAAVDRKRALLKGTKPRHVADAEFDENDEMKGNNHE